MSGSGQALLVVGVLLVAAGLGWRIITTRRNHGRLISLLGSADPATRAGALTLVTSAGIEHFARILQRMSETESDPAVLAALMVAVNRTQAMPARSPELVSLRLWAAGRAPGPALPAEPISGYPPQGPRYPTSSPAALLIDERAFMNGKAGRHRLLAESSSSGAETAVTAVPSRRAVLAGPSSAAEQSTVPLPMTPQPAARRPQPSPAPRGRDQASHVVLVTGAGGPAGVAVIRALRRAGHRVVAADADSSAIGFRLADEFARVPRADDPAFAESIVKAAASYGAEALIPTVAEELRPLHAAAGQLGEAGVATWLPQPWSVEHCVDKWLFHELMTEHDVPVPATGRRSEHGIPGPWIIKPRFGRGSRDVYDADNGPGVAFALSQVPEPLVQTKITGREFTVDTLCDDGGQLQGAVPRWRVETKAGISTKGLTFYHPELVDMVARLLTVLRLAGPACVQGFLTDEGELVFIEVNPRFSGGLPLSLAAGADLVGQYLNRILCGTVQPERLRYRPGVTMLRYFDEVFEG